MENQVNCCNYLFLKGHAINNHFQTRERPGDVIVSNSHIAIVDRVRGTRGSRDYVDIYLIESTWWTSDEDKRKVINENLWSDFLYPTTYSPRRLRP